MEHFSDVSNFFQWTNTRFNTLCLYIGTYLKRWESRERRESERLRRSKSTKDGLFGQSEFGQAGYGRLAQQRVFGFGLLDMVLGGHDGRGEVGSMVSAELVLMEVFPGLVVGLGESGRVLVELFRRSKLETAERRLRGSGRGERLETRKRLIVGIVIDSERRLRVNGGLVTEARSGIR